MSLSRQETARYVSVWDSVPAYGAFAPGEQQVSVFLSIVGDARGTVLDAGCGSGKGALALIRAGFGVTMCDLTDAGLVPEARDLGYFLPACLWSLDRLEWAEEGGWDYAYCCDVLEHIPPQFTMLVVRNLLRIASNGVFLSISLVPDQFGAYLGEALHQTVESFQWWKDSLNELGRVTDARDMLTSATFYVEPR